MPFAMAGANVTTKDYAFSAKALKMYGDLEITGMSVSTSLNQALCLVPESTDLASDDTTFEGFAGAQVHGKVGFDITLGEKCTAVIELENKLMDADDATANFIGEMEHPNIDFGFVYVKADEFLMPNLSLMMGIMPAAFDVRDNGHAFLFSTYENSLSRVIIGDMGGWMLTYHSGNNLAVDFLMFNVMETLAERADYSLYGVHVDYLFASHNENTRRALSAALLVESNGATNGTFYTIGAGVDYYLRPTLELYGELYMQAGECADGVDQEGFALYLGAKFLFESPSKPYVDASLWYITGDDATSDGNQGFMNNYENYHYAIIMDNPVIGADLNSNILALKFSAGATVANGPMKKPLGLNAFLGYYTMAEDNGADASDYGIEFDAMATWYASDSLTFGLGFGYVTGSDLLEGLTVDEETSGYVMLFDTAVKF
jgi:hypothetical protein